ncbi:MAG: hypothetical protein KC777_16120 [Cyanobacteria bacterium HKST-UBA02]|nr:hypothetical protein [Cyanobacteria bacterium HKST-UBA02]
MRVCLIAVFVVALFLSSMLMFVLEPLVAKLILPRLGGAAAVWTACVLYYQVLLLAGYLYSHFLTVKLSLGKQLIVHGLVCCLPFLFLPLRLPFAEPQAEHPLIFLILTLTAMIGAMFFAISTTAPLLQKWYSDTGAPGSADPYFLYAASNAGGIIGLIAYPFFVEPRFSLIDQSALVAWLYGSLAGLIGLLLLLVWSRRPFAQRDASADADPEKSAKASVETSPETDKIPETGETVAPEEGSDLEKSEDKSGAKAVEEPELKRQLNWLALTFVPSTLFLGLTTFVTTELAAVPFFWMVPLLIYLLSFIIAFSRPGARLVSILKIAAPLAVAAVLVFLAFQAMQAHITATPRLVTDAISLHLLALLLVCTACHSLLAQDRPEPEHLTEFYLIVGAGGALGSFFNTLIAPLIFNDWYEYPVALFLSLLVIAGGAAGKRGFTGLRRPLGIFALVVIAGWFFYFFLRAGGNDLLVKAPEVYVAIAVFLLFVLPIAACFALPFGLEARRACLTAAGLIFVFQLSLLSGDVVLRHRNFYGCLKVEVLRRPDVIKFWHGATLHGIESLDPARRGQPVAYFHPQGPLGELMRAVYGTPPFAADAGGQAGEGNADARREPYAVLGLGCGTLASYADRGQTAIFYELDNTVIDIAEDPFYFTYLYQARKRGVDLKLVAGDGRLQLAKAPYDYFKLIVLDAFSSDSIPTHLLTREAAAMYLTKLKKDGLLAFQISNNYYDLKPVLARLARELGLKSLSRTDMTASEDLGRYPTEWVVLYRDSKDPVAGKLSDMGWEPLSETPGFELWTDDYCSILKALIAPFS